MPQFFSKQASRPLTGHITGISSALKMLPAFRAQYALDDFQADMTNCDGQDPRFIWKKAARNAILNPSAQTMERNFFEAIAGGSTEIETIDSKKLTFKQAVDWDYTTISRDSVIGTAPGATLNFTLARSMHSISGTSSFIDEGWSIYIFRNKQMVRVTGVNRDNDYAHLISVMPNNPLYTVDIRANERMMLIPARQVGGYSCNSGFGGRFDPPGYFYEMSIGRRRLDWNMPTDMLRGFEDQMIYAPYVDEKGNESECFDMLLAQRTREDLQLAWNVDFMFGQRIRNGQMFAYLNNDKSYPGMDGYETQVRNGGGVIYPFDVDTGIDPYTDFVSILLDLDSRKQNTEFLMMSSKAFDIEFEKNLTTGTLKREQGQLFNTFDIVKGKDNMMNITRLGIASINLWGFTIHKIQSSVLTDRRTIGNGYVRYAAYLMPSTNLKDSNGRDVPPIEFFVNKGCKETAGYEEHPFDDRNTKDGCEVMGGWVAQARGMIVHNVQNNIIFDPQTRC